MTAKSNTNGASEGTIRIIDTGGVQEQSFEHLDGEITIDLASGEQATIVTDLDTEDGAEVVERRGAGSDHEGAEVTGELLERVGWDHESFAWLPALPATNFLVAVLAAVLVGPDVWSVEASPLGELAIRVGHLWLFGVSLAATLWMWNDAAARADRDADWQPTVNLYVVGGALGITAFGTGFYLLQGVPLQQVVAPATGLFILGLPMSSVFSGPVYLFERSRRAGVDATETEV